MKSVSEMDLPEIDIFDPDFARDPHAIYAEARKKSWIAKYQFGYMLLDYDDMKAFLRDDGRCREPNQEIVMAWNAKDTPFDRFTSNSLVALRGDDHKRIRNLVAPAFTPRTANKHRQFMRDRMIEVIEEFLPKGACDFAELSAQYPITVMCRLIGVPQEDCMRFAKWLEPQEAAFGQDASMLPEISDGLDNMYKYVAGLIEERQKPGDHPDDLLQDLVGLASDDGDQLTDEELKTLLIILLGAGFDTTKNQLNLMIKMLIDNPDELAKLESDSERFLPFINETLRYKNAIGSLHRITDVDIEHNDVLFPANTFVSMPITAYGRDASKYDQPDQLDPDRSGPPSIAFGQGIHMCLGQFLARALLEEGLPIVVERLKNIRLDGEIEYRSPLGIWGYKTLPIAFDNENGSS